MAIKGSLSQFQQGQQQSENPYAQQFAGFSERVNTARKSQDLSSEVKRFAKSAEKSTLDRNIFDQLRQVSQDEAVFTRALKGYRKVAAKDKGSFFGTTKLNDAQVRELVSKLQAGGAGKAVRQIESQFRAPEFQAAREGNLRADATGGVRAPTGVETALDDIARPFVKSGEALSARFGAIGAQDKAAPIPALQQFIKQDTEALKRDPNNKELKEELQIYKQRLNQVRSRLTDEDKRKIKEIASRDETADLANIAESALSVTPIGFGKRLLTGVAGAGAKQVLKRVGVGAAEGAVIGGGIGALDVVGREGKEAQLEDIAKSTGVGAVTGGVLGGVVPAASAVIRSPAGKVTGSSINKVNNAVSGAVGAIIQPIRKTAVGAKIDEVFTLARQKLQQSDIAIQKKLQQGFKEGKFSEFDLKKQEVLTGDVARARVVAKNFLDNDEDYQKLLIEPDGSILTPKKQKALDEYLEARIERNLIDIDPRVAKAGRKEKFDEVIANAPPEYAERYNSLINVNSKLTDMLLKEGILDPQTVAKWRATNQEYVRVQRVIEDLSEGAPRVGGGAPQSISSTVAKQKRKGSTKDMRSPLQVVRERAEIVHKEIARQRAANGLINMLETLGETNQLRSAENVFARQGLKESLALSRPLKSALARFNKVQGKYVRRIQTEVDKLNREGLDAYLTRGAKEETLAGKLADPGAKVTKEELTNILDSLIDVEPQALKAIKAKLGRREPKLSQAIDELQDIRTQLDGVNAQRRLEYDELLKLSDEKARGRPTISRFKDGIKEVYQVAPEIESAAKNWGKTPIINNALARIIITPTRVLRATITGPLNPAYLPKAVIRDFTESFNLSPNAMATHHPVNVVGSIAEAAGKSDLFKKFMSTEGGDTFVDYLAKPKNASKEIMRDSRLQKPKVQKGVNIITRPGEWYNTIEEASRWQELLTRFQNFRGAYNDAIDSGLSEADALVQARWNSRNNATDFYKGGDWTPVLNSIFPYFNASIQGGTRLAKSFKEKPVSTSIKSVISLQIPSALAVAYNLSDPRRADIYLNDIRDYERENNWIFVLPGSEKTNGKWNVVKIPKPAGIGSLSNPVERMMIGMYGHDPGEFGGLVKNLTKAFGSPIDISTPSTAVGSLIPQGAKQIVEDATNYDFFTGKQIVPDWLKEENPDEPFKQDFENTSATAKALGKMMDISPLRVEKFIRSTTGETSQNVLWGIDTAVGKKETAGRSPIESLSRQFTTASGGKKKEQIRQDMDKLIGSKNGISSKITEAIKRDDFAEANKLAREYNKKVESLTDTVKKTKLAELTEGQRKYLDKLRFPVEGGQLTESSIKYRLNK